jgi:hypothetical protein
MMKRSPILLVLLAFALGCPAPDDGPAPELSCDDDAFEPNSDQAGATPTIDSMEDQWRAEDLVLCPGDEDWFSFDIDTGSAGMFGAMWDDSSAQIDVQVFDEDGREVGALGTEWAEGRATAYSGDGCGAVRVRRMDPGQEPVPYRFLAAVEYIL